MLRLPTKQPRYRCTNKTVCLVPEQLTSLLHIHQPAIASILRVAFLLKHCQSHQLCSPTTSSWINLDQGSEVKDFIVQTFHCFRSSFLPALRHGNLSEATSSAGQDNHRITCHAHTHISALYLVHDHTLQVSFDGIWISSTETTAEWLQTWITICICMPDALQAQ